MMVYDTVSRAFCMSNLGLGEGHSRPTTSLIAGLLIFKDSDGMSCMFHWMEEENNHDSRFDQ